MFLSCCSPISRKAMSSLPVASSRTRAETQMPPGSAKPSSRAATLTPSPKMSPSSTTMSPTLIPTRKAMRFSAGTSVLRLAIARWISTAERNDVDHADELDEQSVAGGFDDAAVMIGDLRVDYFGAERPESAKCPFLVG